MTNQDLSQYHDEFISFLKVEKNSSPHTVANYKSDFKLFNTYLETYKILPTIPNMEPPIFRRYIHYLKDNEYKNSSIRRKINGLKSFFNYLVLVDYIPQSPLKTIIVPNKDKHLPIFFSEDQVLLLLRIAKQSTQPDALRDYLLIKLIASTGIRRQEAVNLDFKNIDFKNNSIRILGKGNKERFIPIRQELSDELWLFLQSRVPLSNQAVFVTRTGHRIHASRCHTIFRNLLEIAGLNNQGFSLHKLRHSYATMLVSHGAPIQAVQQLLGHQSLSTTTIYSHTSAEHLKEAADKLPY